LAPGSSFRSDSQPFIISIAEFRKIGFLILWAHNIVVVLKIRYDSSVFRDFGTLGLRVSGLRPSRLSGLLSFPTPDFRNFDLRYPSDPHSIVVTHNYGGTWYINEVPRCFLTMSSVPPLSLFSPTHWHMVQIHVSTSIPRKIQRSDLSQIYSADSFGVSGFRASKVRASTHLELPFAEIMKSLPTNLLDPTVKFFSHNLWCILFWDFEFSRASEWPMRTGLVVRLSGVQVVEGEMRHGSRHDRRGPHFTHHTILPPPPIKGIMARGSGMKPQASTVDLGG
jgi:hypothetical protein